MPRNLFEHEMSDLKGSLVDLGHLIDTIIADTLQMLRQPNPETAAAVARREETVNTMERRIEDSCVNIIALQQPLARDLRTITAALKIVTDMERISDQCCDTCEILRALAPLSEGARPLCTWGKCWNAHEACLTMPSPPLYRTISRSPMKCATATMKWMHSFPAQFSKSAPLLRGSPWWYRVERIICLLPNISNGLPTTLPILQNGRSSLKQASTRISTRVQLPQKNKSAKNALHCPRFMIK